MRATFVFAVVLLAAVAFSGADNDDQCLSGVAMFPYLKLKHVEIPLKRGSSQLGAMLVVRGSFVRVDEIYPGGAADMSRGLERGDVILTVNGKSVVGYNTFRLGKLVTAAGKTNGKWLFTVIPAASPVIDPLDIGKPLAQLFAFVMPYNNAAPTANRVLNSGCFDRQTDKMLQISYVIKSELGDMHVVKDMHRIRSTMSDFASSIDEAGRTLHTLLTGPRPGEGYMVAIFRAISRSLEPSDPLVGRKLRYDLVEVEFSFKSSHLYLELSESTGFRFVDNVKPAVIAGIPQDNGIKYTREYLAPGDVIMSINNQDCRAYNIRQVSTYLQNRMSRRNAVKIKVMRPSFMPIMTQQTQIPQPDMVFNTHDFYTNCSYAVPAVPTLQEYMVYAAASTKSRTQLSREPVATPMSIENRIDDLVDAGLSDEDESGDAEEEAGEEEGTHDDVDDSTSGPKLFRVHASCGDSDFGAAIPWRKSVTMPVAVMSPESACDSATLKVHAGFGTNKQLFLKGKWWALVRRGDCYFLDKARNLQKAGAAGMIVMNNDGQGPERVGAQPGVSAHDITMPIVMLSSQAGEELRRVVLAAQDHALTLEYVTNAEETYVNFTYRGVADATWSSKSFEIESRFSGGVFEMTAGFVGKRESNRPGSVNHDVSVTLEQVFTGFNTTFTVKRNRLCSHCKGRGGAASDIKPCQLCGHDAGVHHDHHEEPTGVLSWLHDLTPTGGSLVMQSRRQTCPACGGSRESVLPGRKCKTCKGSGVVEESVTLTAEFPPGAPTYHRVYFAKEGHQAYQAPSSDVIVTFVVQPHANFTMQHNGDLATTLKISLMEGLVGFNRSVTLPDGRQVPVSRLGMSVADNVLRVPNVALPKFDPQDPSKFHRWDADRELRRQTWRKMRAQAILTSSRMLGAPSEESECIRSNCRADGMADAAKTLCEQTCLEEEAVREANNDEVPVNIDEFPRTDLVVNLAIEMPETVNNSTQQWKEEFRNASIGSF